MWHSRIAPTICRYGSILFVSLIGANESIAEILTVSEMSVRDLERLDRDATDLSSRRAILTVELDSQAATQVETRVESRCTSGVDPCSSFADFRCKVILMAVNVSETTTSRR